MRMFTFGVSLLVLLAENNAAHPEDLISSLIDLLPNTSKLFNLWQPLSLTLNQSYELEPVRIGNFTLNTTQHRNITFNLFNVTVLKSVPKRRMVENYYTELTCEFHNKLLINHAIEPQDLEIRGQHKAEIFLKDTKKLKDFDIKQYTARIRHTVFVDSKNQTELFYLNEEVNVGKNDKNSLFVLSAMSDVIQQVKGKALNNTNTSYLVHKIQDFKHIFPFLSSCLSPANTTENLLLSQHPYKINNQQKHRQWGPFRIGIPEISINGTTNFNWTKIKVSGCDNSSVRIDIIIITNPLKGRFKWYYEKNNRKPYQNISQFFISNLTIKADINYTDKWIVNNMTADVGTIATRKETDTPDINEFTHNILNDYVRSLIVTHYENLMHETYSEEKASKALNDLGILQLLELERLYQSFTAAPQTSNKTNATVGFFTRWNSPLDMYRSRNNTATTSTPPVNYTVLSSTTDCVDTRRWWQKIFIRNKCKSNQTPQVSSTTPANTTSLCVDTRWWLQKLYKKSMCK